MTYAFELLRLAHNPSIRSAPSRTENGHSEPKFGRVRATCRTQLRPHNLPSLAVNFHIQPSCSHPLDYYFTLPCYTQASASRTFFKFEHHCCPLPFFENEWIINIPRFIICSSRTPYPQLTLEKCTGIYSCFSHHPLVKRRDNAIYCKRSLTAREESDLRSKFESSNPRLT